MTPKYFELQLELLEKNESDKSYAELLDDADRVLEELKVPGGCYAPPLPKQVQDRFITEIKEHRLTILEKIKENNESILDYHFKKIAKKQDNPHLYELLCKYFENIPEKNAIKMIKRIDLNLDIVEEFSKCLLEKTFEFEKPLKIEGYTASSIAKANPKLATPLNAYYVLSLLRDNKKEAKTIIEKGFPRQ